MAHYTIQQHAAYITKVRGVSILIHKSVAFELLLKLTDPQGYTSMLTKRQVLHTSQHLCSKFETTQLLTTRYVICGDFNRILDPLLDSSAPIGAPRKRRVKAVCQVLHDGGPITPQTDNTPTTQRYMPPTPE
ncbi:Hypothetical predicted protein [Pelobates cultripes]|uniref:Endonuclease/exonuclease/phosphatase domain-containing protein n=1 Tax=Pelobates cultripes TaxID=61616 RepID=A0AAD1VKC7_PELCU|nr:Hypothetical predicted protein [Pelobates cultripes]